MKLKKNFAVKPNGNYLIDDDIKKVMDWIHDGGIGIWFNKETNSLIEPFSLAINQSCFITNDLLDLFKVNECFKDKTYVKK